MSSSSRSIRDGAVATKSPLSVQVLIYQGRSAGDKFTCTSPLVKFKLQAVNELYNSNVLNVHIILLQLIFVNSSNQLAFRVAML